MNEQDQRSRAVANAAVQIEEKVRPRRFKLKVGGAKYFWANRPKGQEFAGRERSPSRRKCREGDDEGQGADGRRHGGGGEYQRFPAIVTREGGEAEESQQAHERRELRKRESCDPLTSGESGSQHQNRARESEDDEGSADLDSHGKG